MTLVQQQNCVYPENPCFSSAKLPVFQEVPQSPILRALHRIIYGDKEKEINPASQPSNEDILSILSNTRELKSFTIDGSYYDHGVHYVNITLGGIKAEYRKTTTPREVATDILVRSRHHWQLTRGTNQFCVPFITQLNENSLVIGFPVSIEGFKTVAHMQQQVALKKQIEKAEVMQKREQTKQALENFRQQK